MKRITAVLLIILTSASICFAKEKMPADLKALTDKITKISSDYYNALTKVKSANELAAVINRYADQMEKLTPQIKTMEKKYAYMAEEDDESEDDSDDMNDYERVQREWAEQMSGSDKNADFQKFAQYYSDPAVQKALAKLNRIMENIGVSDDAEDNNYNEETEE